jgi:hypothetical protein
MTQRGRTKRTLVALIGLAALATACADHPTAAGGGSGASYPHGADQLVLRIDTSGGFVAPEQTLQQMPSFSLYGDGRVITQGAQTEIYPGPALPSLVVTSITPSGVQSIVQDALAADLGESHSYTTMTVSDMPTTTFTLNVDGETQTTRVYALGAGTSGPSMTAEERKARAALERLSSKVTDLRRSLPAGSVGPDRQYVAEGMRVFAQPYEQQRDPMLHEPEVAWPLSVPLASFGEETSTPGIRCGAVTGADARQLLDAAGSANQLTPWTSDGEQYSLTFRVLLPDEHGC